MACMQTDHNNEILPLQMRADLLLRPRITVLRELLPLQGADGFRGGGWVRAFLTLVLTREESGVYPSDARLLPA
jgi:hypothetical protein